MSKKTEKKKTGKKRPDSRRKGKPGRPAGERWTPNMKRFCDGLARGMTQTDAARHAKYAYPRASGVELMKNRLIIEWQAEYEKMRKKAMQKALNEDAVAQVMSRRQVEEKFATFL